MGIKAPKHIAEMVRELEKSHSRDRWRMSQGSRPSTEDRDKQNDIISRLESTGYKARLLYREGSPVISLQVPFYLT
tara:strand:- start:212 stop:439 length:228 start_codon:yes stop_codon:yes gene_type:complete